MVFYLYRDAGDIGAGHNVTEFHEIIPQGVTGWLEERRYQKQAETTGNSAEYAWLKFRYKSPKSDESTLMETSIHAKSIPLAKADNNARFAIATPDDYNLRVQAIEMMNKAQKLNE